MRERKKYSGKNVPFLSSSTIRILRRYRDRLTLLPFTKQLSEIVDCLQVIIETGQGVRNAR